MISQISLYKLMRQDVRRRGWAAALIFVASLLLFPLMGMIELENKISWMKETSSAFKWEDIQSWYRAFTGPVNPASVIFVTAAAVLLGITGFTYLHSREKLDFYHSFPVRREKFFAGIYLNGVLMFVVPYVFSYILLLILGTANHLKIEDGAAWCLQTVGWNILFFLLIYGVTILAMLLTGKILVGILGAGVLLIYGSLFYYAVEGMMSFFYKTYFAHGKETIGYSPYALFTHTIEKLAKEGHVPAGIMVTALLAVLLVTAACVWCCRIRPTEAAESSMAFSKTEAFVQVAITIPVSVGAGLFAGAQSVHPEKWFLIAGLICAVIISFVIGFIYHLDFKRIFQQKAVIAVSLFFMAGIFVFFKYDLIGYDTYFPKKGEISHIAVKAESCLNYIYGMSNHTQGETLDRLEIPVTNEIYDKLEELVKGADISKMAKGDMRYENSFTVMFRLDSGKRVYRVFYADKEQQVQLLRLFLAEPLYCQEAFQMNEVLSGNIDSVSLSDVRNQYRAVMLNKEQRRTLLDVYQEELLSCDILSLRGTQAVASLEVECYEEEGNGRSYQNTSLPVYERFTRTQALLEEYGYVIQKEMQADEVMEIRMEDNRKQRERLLVNLEPGDRDVRIISDPEKIKEILPYLQCMNLQGLWYDQDPVEDSVYLTVNWKDGSMTNCMLRKGSGILDWLESEEQE